MKSSPLRRIALFNTHLDGGAGWAGRYLTKSFLDFGLEAALYYRYGESAEPWAFRVHKEPAYLAHRFLSDRNELFYNNWAAKSVPAQTFLKALNPRPDLLLIHWSSDFCTPETASALGKELGIPVVYSMADNAILTGGCHYSGGCTRFERGCGHCPQIGHEISRRFDRSYFQFRNTLSAFRAHPNYVIAGSRWQADLCRRSPLPIAGLYDCLVGIDAPGPAFVPPPAAAIRRIVWSASFLSEHRKGFSLFLESMMRFAAQYPELTGSVRFSIIGAGAGSVAFPPELQVDAIERLPYDEFNTALTRHDLLFNSVTDDAGPSILFTAIAHGMAVITTPVGAGLQLVRDGANGWIIPTDDPDVGAQAIARFVRLPAPAVEHMRRTSLQVYSEELQKPAQFRKMMGILNEIVTTFHRR